MLRQIRPPNDLFVAALPAILWAAVACAPTEATPAPAPAPTPTAAVEPTGPTPDPFSEVRQTMVDEQIRARNISDPAVLAAMAAVPRHLFVPPTLRDKAYGDHPLPIGYGQTISQPFIVALMTELVDLKPGERVLEIGTGSGYQAAVLAQVVDEVYTVEIIPELAERARDTFDLLGYTGITARQADGYWGWEAHAPFDAIIVTAAPDHVPRPLINQLADGGRMVIPIGPPGGYQSLWVFERRGDELYRFNWGGVRFVPFTRSE